MSPANALFLENSEITGEPPLVPKELPAISLAQRVLLRAMIDSYSIDPILVEKSCVQSLQYKIVPGKEKELDFVDPSLTEYQRLIERFRKDPKLACGTIRQNLINIARDERLEENDRHDRLKRYLEAYLTMIPILDSHAYPPDSRSVVHEGVPSYIPDGLSDMGSDNTIDPTHRSREKIRVVKSESYKKAMLDMLETLWNLRKSKLGAATDEVKEYLIKHTMAKVKISMPYDLKKYGSLPRNRSIRLDEFVNAGSPVSVCRHIAMETQVRLQALGLESRLLKCDMDGEPHVVNVVRINSQWNLGDPTNPEADPANANSGRVYLKPIVLSENPHQVWTLPTFRRGADGVLKTEYTQYRSRNNMFYRILKND